MAYEILPCLYDLEKDLQARLHGTICRYENKPYYVSVRSAKEIALYDLVEIMFDARREAKELLTIRPTDPKFDISSPELGYMNFDFTAEAGNLVGMRPRTGCCVYFLKRNTARQWRQGLSSESVSISGVSGNQTSAGLSGHQIFYSQGLKDLITITYPTIPGAVHRLSRMEDCDYKQIAVSKDVALERTDSDIIQVWVKRSNVGYILPGERVIHLKKGEYSWITQKFLEMLKTPIV